MRLPLVLTGCEVIGGAVAEALFRDGLCLPSGTALGEADQQRVARVIRETGTPARRVEMAVNDIASMCPAAKAPATKHLAKLVRKRVRFPLATPSTY
jgi:hypothetical protein